MIKDRCRKLLTIFSKDFFNSDMNSFLATFAQHCGLEEGLRKLVPLVYERCDIPGNLSLYHKLPYDPTNQKHKWFWEKLVKTLHPQGAFDSSINMLDIETPGPAKSSVTPSAPQRSKESTPTAITERKPKKLLKACRFRRRLCADGGGERGERVWGVASAVCCAFMLL